MGCASKRGLPPDTSAYRAVASHIIVAWGWGGAAGYQDEDGFPIRVLFSPDADATNYRLIMCDPAESPCDSLKLFGDLALAPRPFAGEVLAEFRTKISEADQILMVIADRDGELITSDPIVATVSSRPTGYAKNGLDFDRHDQEFSWPRVPDAALFVLTVADEKNPETAAGVATRRKSWIYPELVGIVQQFHDPARVRDLERGKKYDAVLFAINGQRWATLITDAVVSP